MTDTPTTPGGGLDPAAGGAGSAAPPPAGASGPGSGYPDLSAIGRKLKLLPLGLLTAVVVSRGLGPSGRGSLAAMAAVAGAGVALGRWTLPPSASGSGKEREGLRPLLGLILAWALGAGLVLLSGLRVLARFAPGVLPLASERQLWLAAAWIPVGLLVSLQEELQPRLRQDRRFGRLEHGLAAWTLALLCALFLLGVRTPESFFLATLTLTALAALLALRWSIQLVGGAPVLPSAALLRRMLASGARAYPATVCVYALMYADLLIVAHVRGTTEAGFYAVATGIARSVLVIPVLVTGFLGLLVMRETDDPKADMAAAAVTCAFALVLVALLARPVVTLLFGRAFLPAVPPLLWLLPGTYAVAIGLAALSSLRLRVIPAGALVALVLVATANIGLNLWLIPRSGIVGAAQASSLAYALLTLFGVAYFIRRKW